MFELMDANQEALDLAHKERLELENLWKQEKDKLRITQRVSGTLSRLKASMTVFQQQTYIVILPFHDSLSTSPPPYSPSY